MAVMRKKATGSPVIVKQIESDAQIGRWLAEHNLIEPPQPFDTPPHVGEPGEWIVSAFDSQGIQSFDVMSDEDFSAQIEPMPI